MFYENQFVAMDRAKRQRVAEVKAAKSQEQKQRNAAAKKLQAKIDARQRADLDDLGVRILKRAEGYVQRGKVIASKYAGRPTEPRYDIDPETAADVARMIGVPVSELLGCQHRFYGLPIACQ